MSRFQYVFDAWETIQRELAKVDSDAYSDDVRDQALLEAGRVGCTALTRLSEDGDFWNQFQPVQHNNFFCRVLSVLITNQRRFDKVVLPVTAKLLQKLGYKPPEQAAVYVERCRAVCEGIDPSGGTEDPREILWQLKNATCGSAADFRKRFEGKQNWKRIRKKLKALLIGACGYLLTAQAKVELNDPNTQRWLHETEHHLYKEFKDEERRAAEIIFEEYAKIQAWIAIEAAKHPDQEQDPINYID